MPLFGMILAMLIGMFVGDRNADQTTINDCASKGQAHMMNGVIVIECKVLPSTK